MLICDHPLTGKSFDIDAYCNAVHVLVSFSDRDLEPREKILAAIGKKRRIGLTANQFFILFQVVSASGLVSIVPQHLISANRMSGSAAVKEIPVDLPVVRIDMLWPERNACNPAHRWLRNAIMGIAVSEVAVSPQAQCRERCPAAYRKLTRPVCWTGRGRNQRRPRGRGKPACLAEPAFHRVSA